MTPIKTTTVHARVSPQVKREAQVILKKLGLSTSEAVALFLRQVSLNKGLPFPLRIPNKESLQALKELRTEKNLETYETVDAWSSEIRKL